MTTTVSEASEAVARSATDLCPAATTGLYVHFPWCVRKCPYCDFNSHPMRAPLPVREYMEVLAQDLALETRRHGDPELATVFLGGGTPSLFPPDALRPLLRGARLAENAEVTLEANPGAVECGDFGDYRAAGITRVSLGAQSFDAGQLATLGRIHSPDETRAATERVHKAGFESFNIDLMYGLSKQTSADAVADLEQAIALDPPHISWYQLTIEPRTEFAGRPPPGLPDSDAAADIEAAGIDLLERHGYRRYEVSAWARPGHEARHNVNYWRFGDYLGIGAGAHGKHTSFAADGRTAVLRTAKPSQPRRYLANHSANTALVASEQLAFEFMLNALRLTGGVEWDLFAARTGLSRVHLEPTVSELVEWDLMHSDRIALTAKGRTQLDAVVSRFLEA